MSYLADVNVWLAMALSGHVHHEAARDWFEDTAIQTIAFSRITQNGFLRLLTNPRVMGPNVVAAADAWKLYDAFYQDSRVRFASEPPGLEERWRAATDHPVAGQNFWTDAYLATFAAAAGFTVVTFDRGFRRHRGVKVHLLPDGNRR